MKKYLAIILSVVMVLGLLTACGGDTKKAEGSASAAVDDGEVYEFIWAHHDPDESTYGKLRLELIKTILALADEECRKELESHWI